VIVFLLKRLANAAGVMVAVALIAFLIFRFLGDPVELMLNEQASQAQRDALRLRLGLDRGVVMQFVTFLVNALRGDFGISFRNQQDVFQLIAERMPATLELVFVATLLSLLIGIPLGVYTAIRRNAPAAQALQFLSVVGVSLPSFAVGILLILLFSVTLGWLPASGFVSPFEDWRANVAALVMPAFVLGNAIAAVLMRHTRSAMLQVLSSDYVRTARAKGVPERGVVLRHALRNALIPVITLGALELGTLLSGAVLTEQVFSIPGFGKLIVDAVFNRDYAVVQGVVLFTATAYIVLNLLADILYVVVDPRIRVG